MAGARFTNPRLAIQAVLTNAIEYRSGPARLRIWTTGSEFICEVESCGWFTSPFAGLVPPSTPSARDGGLWVAGQMCDLVAVRGLSGTTTVRLRFSNCLVSTSRECDGIDQVARGVCPRRM